MALHAALLALCAARRALRAWHMSHHVNLHEHFWPGTFKTAYLVTAEAIW
jgi:hypothetical protein